MTTRKLFGTDGIRGMANAYPISAEFVLKLGQAIGCYFKSHHSHPRILIGKDTRRSGYLLEQALSSGICSMGVDTYFVGPLPTPGIAYLTRGMRATAGIVISASHNPYYDNGIKIFSKDGYKLPDEVENNLEKLVFSEELEGQLPTGEHVGTAQRIDDALGQYAVFLKEQFPKHLSLEGIKIVIDCAHGAAYKVGPKVFSELGADVVVTNAAPDGININENCGALHPAGLAEAVKLHRADMGFAFDGDADRLVVVDEKGEILDGDEILAICGIYYLKKNRLKKKAIVSTVMSNMGLELSLRRHGGSVIRTQVGDRYVVEKMLEGDYNLGGEQSGHLIFRDCSTTGDGILAALSLLESVLESQQPLSELKTCMQRFPQVLKSLDVSRRVPIAELHDVNALISSFNHRLGQDGRILFRYSGTELKARIMIEGPDRRVIEEMLEELSETTLSSINRHPSALKSSLI